MRKGKFGFLMKIIKDYRYSCAGVCQIGCDIKEDNNQTLAVLVSIGKNQMLLFNKIENGKTTEDWISYYSSDLPNNILSIKEFLKTNKAGNSKSKKAYAGHFTLLK